jgi:hypothetical protein
VERWQAKAHTALEDAQDGPDWAGVRRRRGSAVREDLIIVLVLLITYAHLGVLDVGGHGGRRYNNTDAVSILEDEVLSNKSNGVGPVTPEGVGDTGI